jgi:hypothetical protein
MTRYGLIALALAAGLGVADGAQAQSFNRADTNHDGFVTFQEARRVMPLLSDVHFRRCDRNGDGRLDLGEFNCVTGIYNALYRDR